MAEIAEFFGVLLLLYVFECGAWIPRSSFGLARTRARVRVVHPPELLGNVEAGWMPGDLLPWRSTLHVLHGWPVALDARGVVSAPVLALDPALKLSGSPALVAWDALEPLESEGARVLARRREIAHVATPARARALRRMLSALARTPEGDRTAAIEAVLDEHLEPLRIARRIETFERAQRVPTVLASAHLVFVFAVAPWVVVRFGFVRSWPGLLIGLAALTLANGIAFAWAHRVLFPDERVTRWGHVAHMLLMPLTAARSRDLLARELFDDADPVLVASLLGGGTARPHVEAALRDLAHPSPPSEAIVDPEARAALATFRAAWRSRLVATLGIDADATSAAPPRERDAHSYCPRCLTQFLVREACCDACGDRPTVAFASTSVERPC